MMQKTGRFRHQFSVVSEPADRQCCVKQYALGATRVDVRDDNSAREHDGKQKRPATSPRRSPSLNGKLPHDEK